MRLGYEQFLRQKGALARSSGLDVDGSEIDPILKPHQRDIVQWSVRKGRAAIFLGIGFKFNDLIQAIHRIHRFLQSRTVRIDLIYTEAEREVRRIIERKWEQHRELTAQMTEIIRAYGLADSALEQELQRSIGVERVDASGERYMAVNNDAVLETATMESDSVHLIITSIPFSTQYEYTPSYNDFGHTDSNDHFFQQTVYDPFGGLMTVPYCAVKLGRRGIGCELSKSYWLDGVHYLRQAEAEVSVPTLFDLVANDQPMEVCHGN